MNRMRLSALFLSTLLHLTPLVRVAVAESALVGSPLLAVLRWVAGATAVAGALHGVSGASGMGVTQGGATVTLAKGTTGVVLPGVRVTMFSLFGAPRAFTFQGLPPGLNGSAQGVITGIPTKAGSYSVTVLGWELPNATGNVFGAALPFTIAAAVPDPPGVTSSPTDQTLAAGSPLSLSAVVTGSGVTYQWRKDGVEIPAPAGTSATYSVAAVQLSDAGRYTVVVTNAGGSAESAAAVVTVVSLPVFSVPLQSQTVIAGSPATFAAAVSGIGLSYQWFKETTPIPSPAGTSAMLGIASTQPADAGVYSLTVSNLAGSVSSGDVLLTVVTVPTFQFPPIGRTVVQGTSVSLTAAAFGGGLSYQWFKDEAAIPGPKGTGATLDLGPVTAADAGNYVLTISNLAGSATSGPATLVVVTPPVITVPPSAIAVAEGAAAQLRVEASGVGLSFQWTKDDAPISAPAGTGAVLVLSPATSADAGVYVVTVKNAAGSVTSIPVTVTVVAIPSITLQPLPVSVKVGSSLQLTAAASGSGLSFQWFRGTLALPDAIGTSPTLTIAAATLSDAGDYVLRVSNLAGSVSSQAATVTVTPSALQPTLLANLVGGTAYEGEAVTFTARVSTSDPVTYRWTKNGTAVDGATSGTLRIDAVQGVDAGAYRAEVTSGGVSGVTSVIDLSVVAPPVISLSPLSAGQATTLTLITLPGRSYRVESLISLSGLDWLEVTTVTAEATTTQVPIPALDSSARFFRALPVPLAP